MNINEKHHQRRISTSRRVNIIGQSNFSITFTLRQRGKGTGTHTEHTHGILSNVRKPSDGKQHRPSQAHTASHARTHERNEYDFPVGLTPPTSDICYI